MKTSNGPAARDEKPRGLHTSADLTEEHVLAVLAGSPPEDIAAGTPVAAAELADAVSAYRAAGRVALDVRDRRWHQVRIQFPDWHAAESIAANRLWPALHQMQEDGALAGWWFIRKHPYWRLRATADHDGTPGDRAQMITALTRLLDKLVASGHLVRWQESIYEPEILTFGGPYGIDLAHHLFHADSTSFLHHLHHSRHARHRRRQHAGACEHPARRELSLLVCGTLLRAARLDDPEQADVWHRVVQLRPLPDEPPAHQLQHMTPAIRRLLTPDTTPIRPLLATGGVLAHAAGWFTAVTEAGHRLADADRDGALERGLRTTLASHVIFHWNRLGLPARTQAVLARAARHALLNPADTASPADTADTGDTGDREQTDASRPR